MARRILQHATQQGRQRLWAHILEKLQEFTSFQDPNFLEGARVNEAPAQLEDANDDCRHIHEDIHTVTFGTVLLENLRRLLHSLWRRSELCCAQIDNLAHIFGPTSLKRDPLERLLLQPKAEAHEGGYVVHQKLRIFANWSRRNQYWTAFHVVASKNASNRIPFAQVSQR
jgi:hypothetical protein